MRNGASEWLILCAGIAMALCGLSTPAYAQDAAPPIELNRRSAPKPAKPAAPAIIPLTVPVGTPIQIALDKEVRVRKAGQVIRGRVMQPVYAFDRLVIPVGTVVAGEITAIEPISRKRRTLSLLNADFTPPRKVEVNFNEILLANGQSLPLHALITSGSGQVIQLVGTKDNGKKGAKDAVSKKISAEKQQAKQQWDAAIKQVKDSGKMHRLERYAMSQLPAHPQYMEGGTLYFAELEQPLDFGSEPLTPGAAASMKTLPPPGSLVHALLVTPLDSATTKRGAEVEAVLSQPLFGDDHQLILPEGSRLKGTVVQVHPARRMHKNGEMRLVFHELIPPDGLQQEVDASLESVQADKQGHVNLDTEGGAQATDPKTRYLSTGISVALAMASFHSDADGGDGGGAAGNSQNRAAGGATGFKLIGLAMGLFVHSQPLGMAMGAYGGGMSVYSHFLARGHEVVFPQDTAMEIGLGGRITPSTHAAGTAPAPQKP